MSTIATTGRTTILRDDTARPAWSLHMQRGNLVLNIWGRPTFNTWTGDEHHTHGYAGGVYGEEVTQCGCGEMLSADEWTTPLPEVTAEDGASPADAAAEALASAADALIAEAWPQWVAAYGTAPAYSDEEAAQDELDGYSEDDYAPDEDVNRPTPREGDIAAILAAYPAEWSLQN